MGYQAMRTQSKLLMDICESHNLIGIILDDLENYLQGLALDEGYSHAKNV